MKNYLMKRKKRLEDKKAALVKRAQETTDVNELRAIQDEIMDIANELHDIGDELANIAKTGDDDGDGAGNDGGNGGGDQGGDSQRSAPPANAQLKNGDVARSVVGSFAAPEQRSDDVFASLEYRQAFMAYAQRGTPIPATFKRDGEPANTTDLGATIPTTVLNEFINEVRVRYGQLYAKVRKINIKGAVKVPIAKLQAEFKWITESTVSPRQNGGEFDDFVEFSYNMAEIRVAQTLLSSIVTLDLFEREIVRIMTIAYLQAMDRGIISGTGNGQMLGILNDPRVLATGNVVTMTAAQINDWTAWRKNFFKKLPLGYRDGEFIFSLATVDAYLETMADNNNNPIFRQATGLEVNDGDSRNPNGRFFGRNITLVEPDILPDFDSANSGDVIGVFWQPQEYAINTNMAFGMRRWFDEDRNEWVNKMLTVVDGKVLNPMGFWLIKKA